MNAIKTYLGASSHRFYGAIIALVMITLYEILILFGGGVGTVIRNAPEAWVRNTLNLLGISHYHISFILVTVAIIAIPVFYSSELTIRARIFGLIVVESIFWGSVSGVIIQFFVRNLLFSTSTISGSVLGDIGLAIGAGLFEELFFRVLLTTFLIWVSLKLLRVKWLAIVCSVIIASFLFSLAHYIGSMGDVFSLYSFTFRFIAGIWFTTLFTVRGFAVVCLTHAFYDIFVIFL